MFLTGALLTQKISGIWFFVNDVILIVLSHCGKRFKRGNRVQPTAAHQKRRWWLEFDSWRVNLVVLALVVVGGTVAWFAIDCLRRAAEPALEPGKVPHDPRTRAGWALGMLGLLCYNFPRIRQILKILRQRTLGNNSLYMYMWLIAQNITMLVSILAITPPGGPAALGHFFGQAPFLGNILALYFRYDHGKRHPAAITEASEGESDTADMAEAGLLAGDERSHPMSRPERHPRDRHAQAVELERHHDESLRLEGKRARGRAGQLPILARRRLASHLDRRATEEEQHWHDFEDSQSAQGSNPSGEELNETRRRLEDKRRRLKDLRTSRRKSDAQAETAFAEDLRTHPLREHIDRRKARSSGRSSSAERQHGPSGSSDEGGSSDEAEELYRHSTRSTRATRSIDKRAFHPRRGVGTES
ncbi:hypothetical protein Rt10032_c06g2676 [Rhodotorula toruloides]|uniref:Uncharacterized protein n=1 Tax=Rhodotorula toruloides TaxID=5286 RepID=A0A511KE57_RHOTO|nr:hypothetical protein Rt10032_c06g2676 [Rhodotorula toruloides]